MDGLPLESEFSETNYSREPFGPSSRGCCKVSNNNACGSGSLVGKRNDKSLVLTNAHVAGTRLGHLVECIFPFADNLRALGRVIMAGYSDRVMMDWAVVELDRVVDLPHTKLSIDAPRGEHYTGGYPRCRGPYFQRLRTTRITHSGTVWRWQPNSIGGQSGSGVHAFDDDLQRGLLTWSWGGDGAGQTARGIWFQYANRGEVGFARPPGLIELADNKAEQLEQGFFAEANITTLPIWEHLDDDDDDDDDGGDPEPNPKLAAEVIKQAGEIQKRAAVLVETARKYQGPVDDASPDDDREDEGPLFGL